jgi:hypothetical protein
VTTIVNGVNNDAVGPIVDFAIRNIDKIQTIAFQPVSFTGRDEEVEDETRYAQRYTLSQMVEDLETQLSGDWKPMRDWFPLSSYSAFTSVMDILQGADAPWGWSACNCHPNCGIFSLLVVNRRTREWTPLFKFFDYEQFIRDVALITDTARGRVLTTAQLAIAILRNFKPDQAPKGFPISEIVSLFKPSSTNSGSDRNDRMNTRSDKDDWRVFCASKGCGSRICGPTISGAPKCASSPTEPRRERSPSARTIPASAGGRSLNPCTKRPTLPSGTRSMGATRSLPRGGRFRCSPPPTHWSCR